MRQTPRVTTAQPIAKITNAALCGAIVTIGVWAAQEFGDYQIPGDVAAGCTMLLTALVGYATPIKDGEIF